MGGTRIVMRKVAVESHLGGGGAGHVVVGGPEMGGRETDTVGIRVMNVIIEVLVSSSTTPM